MAQRRKPMSEINVVPYIDVMLVLLVIFMATAPLLTQGVKVDLPQAPSKSIESNESDPLVVSMRKDGALFMNVGIQGVSAERRGWYAGDSVFPCKSRLGRFCVLALMCRSI